MLRSQPSVKQFVAQAIHHYTVCLTAELPALQELRDLIMRAAHEASLNEKETHDLMLAADEAATNIIKHATEQSDCDLVCRCTSNGFDNSLTVELQYDASELFSAEPPTAIEIEERLRSFQRGGLGVYLMHKLVDSVDYLHQNGRNVIRMLKKHKW